MGGRRLEYAAIRETTCNTCTQPLVRQLKTSCQQFKRNKLKQTQTGSSQRTNATACATAKGVATPKKCCKGEGTLKMIISIVEFLLVNNMDMQNSRFLNGKYLFFKGNQ